MSWIKTSHIIWLQRILNEFQALLTILLVPIFLKAFSYLKWNILKYSIYYSILLLWKPIINCSVPSPSKIVFHLPHYRHFIHRMKQWSRNIEIILNAPPSYTHTFYAHAHIPGFLVALTSQEPAMKPGFDPLSRIAPIQLLLHRGHSLARVFPDWI